MLEWKCDINTILLYLTYYYVHNVLKISPLLNRHSESTFDIVSRSKLTQVVLDIMKTFLTHRCIYISISHHHPYRYFQNKIMTYCETFIPIGIYFNMHRQYLYRVYRLYYRKSALNIYNVQYWFFCLCI